MHSYRPVAFSSANRCLAAIDGTAHVHRQSPVSGLLSFINSVGRRKPSSMEKLRRTYEDVGQQRSQCSTLTVLQWNVLADGLAQNGDFQRVSQQVLSWESRSPQILQEIVESQADLICLQEVNRYEDFFKPSLERLGYRGIFWPKACSPAEQYGYPCDGCALFYRAERLELIGSPQGQPFKMAGGVNGKQGMLHAVFHDRHAGCAIVAATTHLKAKAGQANEAARQAQAQLMMGRLSAAAAGISSAACNGTSSAAERDPLVILCGDFNDSPPSPACQVVRDHHLGLECIWDAHPPNSAASNGASCPEKEPFTTWKFRSDGASKRTIDFIWYSRDPRLRLLRRWRMPSEADIGESGLPCEGYPSDHLSLCAVFEIS
ncbi:g3509 [Coccomyxa viridis]|uniref:G3509 protein n=1 Tax=Coccomyxa viridis TaxID=1274662 RepID=A0ABP1FMZ2_9CHLO